MPLSHQRESGGGAYFSIEPNGDQVIRDLSLDVAETSQYRMRLDWETMRATAERHALTTGYASVSCWHNHPSYVTVTRPSSQDLRSWLGSLDWAGTDSYLGVIVSACPRRGWIDPRLTPSRSHATARATLR